MFKGNPFKKDGQTTYPRVKNRCRMPRTIYDLKYKNIPRPPVDTPIYANQGISYHQENDPEEMEDDPQRFDLMSVTRTDRKVPNARKNWDATQLKDFEAWKEWMNGYSGSSQWNLCRKMEPSRLQSWLREVHLPEVGFAGYEHNMYRRCTVSDWFKSRNL